MGDPSVTDPAGAEDDPPDWLRQNVEEFETYYPRPYRPPRFSDDVLVPPVVFDLQDELGVDVQLRVVDPQDGNRWEVVVDRSVAGEIDRERHVNGYSLFNCTAAAFEAMVRDAVER